MTQEAGRRRNISKLDSCNVMCTVANELLFILINRLKPIPCRWEQTAQPEDKSASVMQTVSYEKMFGTIIDRDAGA